MTRFGSLVRTVDKDSDRLYLSAAAPWSAFGAPTRALARRYLLARLEDKDRSEESPHADRLGCAERSTGLMVAKPLPLPASTAKPRQSNVSPQVFVNS